MKAIQNFFSKMNCIPYHANSTKPAPLTDEQHRLLEEWQRWASEPGMVDESRHRALLSLKQCMTNNQYELNLSYMGLSSIPPLPPGVPHIDLSHNNIQVIPIPLPDSLVTLNLDDNLLTTFPHFPANLQQLHLSKNKLQHLGQPNCELVLLDVSHNPLEQLPNIMHTSLNECMLSGTSLNHDVCFPSTLEKLYLDNCNLTAIPDLTALPQLKLLSMSHNRFDQSQMVTPPQLPASLQALYIKNSSLHQLPTPLPPQLTHLDVSDNYLMDLPTLTMGLKTVNIANNCFMSTPPMPASVRLLDVKKNILTELPDCSPSCTFNIAENMISPNVLAKETLMIGPDEERRCLKIPLKNQAFCQLSAPLLSFIVQKWLQVSRISDWETINREENAELLSCFLTHLYESYQQEQHKAEGDKIGCLYGPQHIVELLPKLLGNTPWQKEKRAQIYQLAGEGLHNPHLTRNHLNRETLRLIMKMESVISN